MPERPQRDETVPTVNIQDVEHDARPETRVSNAGVPVKDRSRNDARETEESLVRPPPD